jgi:hypothetical protein
MIDLQFTGELLKGIKVTCFLKDLLSLELRWKAVPKRPHQLFFRHHYILNVEIMVRAEVLITFIRFWQFKSQINTNSTQRKTPAFIPNKWADPLWRGRADLIRVKTRISNNFMWRQKIGGKVQWNKEKRGNNEHDKIIQYFPHHCKQGSFLGGGF